MCIIHIPPVLSDVKLSEPDFLMDILRILFEGALCACNNKVALAKVKGKTCRLCVCVCVCVLTLNQPQTHKCVQSLHYKSIQIYMGVIQGANILYTSFSP